MSTKIYDAYRFRKERMEAAELMRLVNVLKKKVRNKARDKLVQEAVDLLVLLTDIRDVLGRERLMRMRPPAQKSASLTEKGMDQLIQRILSGGGMNKCMDLSLLYLISKEKDKENARKDIGIFSAKLIVFPIKDKTLAMYFGSPEFKSIIDGCGFLYDWHYQDQTDRPEGVGKSEWNKRRQDWEEAIGPDYVPARHGLTSDLHNTDELWDIFFDEVKPDSFSIPAKQIRAERLTDYIECPLPKPEDGCLPSEWMRFLRSAEYKEWKKQEATGLKDKLKDVRKKDIFR